MSPEILGLLIGGVVPALCYGVSGVFQKVSSTNGIGTGIYLVIVGAMVTFVGFAFYLIVPDRTVSIRSAFGAGMMGFFWALGAGCVAWALSRYQPPLGKLVPLYNMNTLIAVLIALWLFAEWQQVNTSKLLLGAVFIALGGALVARA